MSINIRRVVMDPEPLQDEASVLQGDITRHKETLYKKGRKGGRCPFCNTEFEKLNLDLVHSAAGSLIHALKATCPNCSATASLTGETLARVLQSTPSILDAGNYTAPPEPKRSSWFW